MKQAGSVRGYRKTLHGPEPNLSRLSSQFMPHSCGSQLVNESAVRGRLCHDSVGVYFQA